MKTLLNISAIAVITIESMIGIASLFTGEPLSSVWFLSSALYSFCIWRYLVKK